jgi:hypothetical protein
VGKVFGGDLTAGLIGGICLGFHGALMIPQHHAPVLARVFFVGVRAGSR